MAMIQPVDVRGPAVAQRQQLMQRVVQNFSQDLQRRQQLRSLLQGGVPGQGPVSGAPGGLGVGVRFNPTGSLPGGGLGPSSRIAFQRLMAQQLPAGLLARLGPGGIDRAQSIERGPAPGSFADAARASLPSSAPGLPGAVPVTSPAAGAPQVAGASQTAPIPTSATPVAGTPTSPAAAAAAVASGSPTYNTTAPVGSSASGIDPGSALSTGYTQPTDPYTTPQGYMVHLGNGLFIDPATLMIHGSPVRR